MQHLAKQAGMHVVGYAQSIIGATEKRRESGAGVAVIGDIGGSGMGKAGMWAEFIRNGVTNCA